MVIIQIDLGQVLFWLTVVLTVVAAALSGWLFWAMWTGRRINEVWRLYDVRQTKPAYLFLFKHPRCVDKLIEAEAELDEAFGGLTDKPWLYYDHAEKQIWVAVRNVASGDVLFPQMDAFDEHWYLDQPLWFRVKVGFDV